MDIYKKLLKTTRRLTRFSDSNEKKLRQVNLKATKQQEELEKAHQTLTQHAELLEEKVDNRTKELVAVQEKLEKLVEMGIGLSRERNLNRFKAMILNGAKELTNADGGALLLRTEDDRLVYELFGIDSLDLRFGGSSGREIPFEAVQLRDPKTDRPDYYNLLTHAVMTERTVNVPYIRKSSDFDFSSIFKFDKKYKYRSHSYLAVPLKPSHGEVIGLLLLFNARVKGTGRVVAFSHEMAGFVEGLASQAAVALVNQQLLKAKEKLLADKKEHLVPRPGGDVPYDVEALGLKIEVPDYLYNLGELYNLMLPKGTLTDEERFKIQEHAILTIVMLKQLPFPKNLNQVVDIAGCHHETLIGTGYPRKVPIEEMSVKARILAIADVFEALTAADRPYKKAKTLSEALKIMSFMRKDQHIDPVLFDLLLSSGIFSDYAKRFLRKEQIDDFDISQFMSKAA